LSILRKQSGGGRRELIAMNNELNRHGVSASDRRNIFSQTVEKLSAIFVKKNFVYTLVRC